MSLIFIDFSYINNPYSIYITIPLIILYFIFYKIYITKTFKDIFFINIYCVITIVATTLIANKTLLDSKEIIMLLLTIISYYILAFIIIKYLEKTKKILNVYLTISEIEKQEQIQKSLFKITHEVKNPLAVVKGYLSMIKIHDKEKTIRYLEIINNEVNRSLNILDDFKEFSKINIIKEKIILNKLFNDAIETMKPFFNSKNITLNYKSKNNIQINADYNRLKQVIINLLKNSAEACDKFGIITLNFIKKSNYLYITIKDNGMGMNKETLENLCTPFYTTKQNGTGLGVCLSAEIIEAHKGSISYTSKVNKGTTAKIVLPIN